MKIDFENIFHIYLQLGMFLIEWLMLEIEKRYLAKNLPKDLDLNNYKEIIDLYIPASFDHPKIRIRKNGDKTCITKKTRISQNSEYVMVEQTIDLTSEEFDALSIIESKRAAKRRFKYLIGDVTAEIDVFTENLEGLVVVEIEFDNEESAAKYSMPDFCLAEITKEDGEHLAGGAICGKTYSELEAFLKKFNYRKISLPHDNTNRQ